MRVPLRHLVDNLVFTVHGTVWAVYRVTAAAGVHYAADRVRDELLARLTSMVRQLAGAPRWFGLMAQIDAGEVVARMVEGVDLDRRPAWAEVADASLDLLDGVEMYRRTHWLAVPLTAASGSSELQAAVTAGWSDLADRLGLKPAPVSGREVEIYRRKADEVRAELSGGLQIRDATAAEIVWMCQHTLFRGLEEPLLSMAEQAGSGGSRVMGGRLRSPSYRGLGQVRLAEGGHRTRDTDTLEEGIGSVVPRGPWWKRKDGTSPLRRQWIEVETELGTAYQAHLVIGELPAAVVWPQGAWLSQLDRLGFGVDFVVDLHIVSAEKAKPQIRRKKRELVDQADQYGAETSGLPDSLHEAAADLGELGVRLGRTASEVEVQSVTALAVWGATPAQCDARARSLQGELAGRNYQVVRPIGSQEALLALGLPGSPAAPGLREFRQFQLSQDWAMSGAGASVEVGDDRGALLGISLDCGTVLPILLDLPGAPARDSSASLGVVGELGSGKSVLLKCLASSVVDQGGQAIVIDRTPMREWAAFATAATRGRAQIVDAAAATISLDPLRLFAPVDGARWAMSYLSLQLGIGPLTPAGALLSQVVHQVAASPAPSMRAVLEVLEAWAEDMDQPQRAQDAAQLARMLRVVADDRFGRLVFDPTLPALPWQDLDGDMVVITTAGLTLPGTQALRRPELLAQQPLEALIGRAVLYLVAALARQVAFADRSRFALVVTDECYWLTSSSEGNALVHELVHDGRKHNAGVGLGTHDEEELGDATTRGLLAYRVVMRHSDKTLASRALAFLGLDGTDEELQLAVTSLSPVGHADRVGEGMLRDARGRIGRVRVLVPEVDRIKNHVYTTPQQTDRQPTPPTMGLAKMPVELTGGRR